MLKDSRVQWTFHERKLQDALARYMGGNVASDVLHEPVQKAAQLLYDEMRRRAPVNKTGKRRKYRGKYYEPGHLRDSIYQYFGRGESTEQRVVFYVGPNKKKAAYWRNVEYGHWTKHAGKYGPLRPTWVAARPFIRPTWDARGGEAMRVMREGIRARLAARVGVRK